MWLIDTTTLKLSEFLDHFDAPPYAILSHRWGEDEVSFKDYRKERKTTGPGYEKILNCCSFARSRGQKWVWIDTVCIDKRSSAELSEAINSMFRWYRGAVECYAYLSDVTASVSQTESLMTQFRNSLWFTRGWTLQELIAPKVVIFITRDWKDFGTKNAPGSFSGGVSTLLTNVIEMVTGIPNPILCGTLDFRETSVAQRMSWAATRKTSRQEDIAYCLLGIFSINM